MGRRIRFDNLTGGLNTVSALGTINQSPSRTETPDCQNVEYFLLGGIKHMDGNTPFGDVQADSITCGFEYKKDNVKYMVITTDAGEVKVYNNTTAVFDTVYTFPNATTRHSGIPFSTGIVISNGVDDLLYFEKNRNDLLTGTVTGVAGSFDITGTSTKFSTELHVGEFILIGDDTYKVTEISTVDPDTNIKVTPALDESFTDESFNLTEISLCNAKLMNTDDSSVSSEIRGLPLNVYRGRLIVGGNDNNLYYSELGKFYGWDIKYDAGAFSPFYNDTSNLFALGLYGESLVIHRQDFSYILTGADADPSNWQIDPFADISCESQQSFVAINNAYYVYSRKNGGIYPLMKRNMFSDRFVGDELSVKIRNLFQWLDNSKLDKIFAVSVPSKRWMVMYMPFIQGSGINIAMVFDFQTNSWLRRVVPQEVTCAFKYNDKAYIGTADGKILEEFEGLTFDGVKIPFYWKSPWFDFGDGSTYQSIREFRIQIAEDFNVNFFVRNGRDGMSDYAEREIKNKSGLKEALVWSDDACLLTNTVWDGSELDPAIEGMEWADGGFTTYRFPLANSYFQQMQVVFCGNMENAESDTTQGMAVYGFEFHDIQKEEI